MIQEGCLTDLYIVRLPPSRDSSYHLTQQGIVGGPKRQMKPASIHNPTRKPKIKPLKETGLEITELSRLYLSENIPRAITPDLAPPPLIS